MKHKNRIPHKKTQINYLQIPPAINQYYTLTNKHNKQPKHKNYGRKMCVCVMHTRMHAHTITKYSLCLISVL